MFKSIAKNFGPELSVSSIRTEFTEVKQRWRWLVLGWVTHPFYYTLSSIDPEGDQVMTRLKNQRQSLTE